MFSQDRTQLRLFFQQSWQKRLSGSELEPLEQMIVHIVEMHPEYHNLIENPDKLDKDYTPEQGETNPFLHMGMHITLAEQLSTDRPLGIRQCYQDVVQKIGDPHEAEHKMMDCLGLALWEAQRAGTMPDEQRYLECLRKLV